MQGITDEKALLRVFAKAVRDLGEGELSDNYPTSATILTAKAPRAIETVRRSVFQLRASLTGFLHKNLLGRVFSIKSTMWTSISLVAFTVACYECPSTASVVGISTLALSLLTQFANIFTVFKQQQTGQKLSIDAEVVMLAGAPETLQLLKILTDMVVEAKIKKATRKMRAAQLQAGHVYAGVVVPVRANKSKE